MAHVRELSGDADFGAPFVLIADLLAADDENRGSALASWRTFRERASSEATRLAEELDGIEAVGSPQEADLSGRYEAIIQGAQAVGLGLIAREARHRFANHLLTRRSLDRAGDLEAALVLTQEQLEYVQPGAEAASFLMQVGLLYGERLVGDRADNVDEAIAALRIAHKEALSSGDPSLAAVVGTNLAVMLGRSERGDIPDQIDEAISLCESALEFRSPARDIVDWAFSQLNLGDLLQRRAEINDDRAALDRARETYLSVIQQWDGTDSWILGAAHHAVGRLLLSSARATPERLVDAHAQDELDGLLDVARELREALAHLEAARPFMRTATDPNQEIRLAGDLVEVLGLMDRDQEAAHIAQLALDDFSPAIAPVAVRRVASWLGAFHADRQDWSASAEAYSTALEAAELAIAMRLDDDLWLSEFEVVGNLFRWAAYVFARVGNVEQAARILDRGRARELSRRLGSEYPLPDLPDVPGELISEYRQTAAEIRRSPMDKRGATLNRRLSELQRAITEISGVDLQRDTAGHDLADAVQDGWPVVFVNPVPHGTLFVKVERDVDGPLFAAEFLDSPTAMDVYMRLLAGTGVDDDGIAEPRDTGSYLFSVSGAGRPSRSFKRELDDLLPWLGNEIARPLAAFIGLAPGVSLVLCGPLALAPVHTSSWSDNGHDRCLVDALPVRFFPSLALGAVAMRRSAARAGEAQRYLGVADPVNDLPAAGPEVQAAGDLFSASRRTIAVGAAATTAFLLENAASASVLHLATHARGGLFDRSDAHIRLADGTLAIGDLAAIGVLEARLVTLSACQTAQTTIGRVPDESLSIGSAIFAAGAACVVATLWSVVDAPAALISVKLHELLVAGVDPPTALQEAQCWLKRATNEDLRTYIGRHRHLRALEHGLPVNGDRGSARPYSHADYWAGFVAVGA